MLLCERKDVRNCGLFAACSDHLNFMQDCYDRAIKLALEHQCVWLAGLHCTELGTILCDLDQSLQALQYLTRGINCFSLTGEITIRRFHARLEKGMGRRQEIQNGPCCKTIRPNVRLTIRLTQIKVYVVKMSVYRSKSVNAGRR